MAEKIGNAITDEKNTVELMTADTVIMSGDNDSLVCCTPLQTVISGTANSVMSRGFMALIEKDGEFYQVTCITSISPNESMQQISENTIKSFVSKITLPTA